MGITGAVIIIMALGALGLSIWGLFNKNRSVLCALAGVVLLTGALLGALHAWGEGQSISWTAAYLVAALCGLVSVVRQVIPKKQGPLGIKP